MVCTNFRLILSLHNSFGLPPQCGQSPSVCPNTVKSNSMLVLVVLPGYVFDLFFTSSIDFLGLGFSGIRNGTIMGGLLVGTDADDVRVMLGC